jgi:hypothetical protein
MYQYLFVILLCLFFKNNLFSQISMADSTVQTLTYWAKGDVQEYDLNIYSLKINGNDSSERTQIICDLVITVLDSGATFYIIEWHYKNIKSLGFSELWEEIHNLKNDVKIKLKISEMGELQDIVNWKSIQKNAKKKLKKIKKSYPKNDANNMTLALAEGLYKNKNSIFLTAMKDAHQYFNFHGGKYKLGEQLTGNVKVPSLFFSSDSIDSAVNLFLDEIYDEDNNYVIRMMQTVDSNQLTEAAFNYLSKLNKAVGKPEIPKEMITPLTNEINIAARIHTTGWVMYSIETKEVEAENIKKIEETIIEIK